MSLVSIYNQIASSNSRHASASASGHAVPVVIASAAIGHEDLGEHGTLTIVLIRLLDDAAEAIYRDREAARTCIARASALLQARRGRENVGHEQPMATLVSGGLAPWQIVRVRTYIEAHLDSAIRIRDLATITRLSVGHFSRSFTRCVGVTPGAYIAGCRLARAQNLMLMTDEPLSQIALACGFYDQSDLARVFRRHLGTSPNTWRRRHKEEPPAPLTALSMSVSGRGDVPGATDHRAPREIYASAPS
jgi:AraC family transcriptional regulator